MTSDLQFAQKTRDKMREYGRGSTDKINKDTAMALAMRFQVDKNGDAVVNSELVV